MTEDDTYRKLMKGTFDDSMAIYYKYVRGTHDIMDVELSKIGWTWEDFSREYSRRINDRR